jgi:hypothetical protein
VNTAAPQLDELQPLCRKLLEEDAYFVALSDGIEEEDSNGRLSVVMEDDGTIDKTAERLLRTKGVCVLVSPVLDDRPRSQSDSELMSDCEIMVRAMTNPTQIKDTANGGANVRADSVCKQIKRIMCRGRRHPGGERFKFVESSLSDFDTGLLAYDLIFRKEIVHPA